MKENENNFFVKIYEELRLNIHEKIINIFYFLVL